MHEILTAITNDVGLEKKALTIIVNIENSDEKPCAYAEQALRAVARDFIATTAGQEFLKETCGNFNYGDLVNAYIPEYIWNKHDISIVDTFLSDICVNHDDQLVESED